MMNNYKYASPDGFSLSEEDVEELTTRLQVAKSIITFNAEKLRGHCDHLCGLHESFRRNILLKPDVAVRGYPLPSQQMALALEFYLQIDGESSSSSYMHITLVSSSSFSIFFSVDIFYMKTCSFRGANPRSNSEGLFCGAQEPEARYAMVPCRQLSCPCCYPLHQNDKSQPWAVVDFVSSATHKFINGYTTYLNCPAVCVH